MRRSIPIPVRLTPDILRRLDAAVIKTGMNTRASIIKICVSGFLDYFERTGMAGLPLNYKEIIHDLDGRSQRYRDVNVIAQQSVVNGNMINHHSLKATKTPEKYRKQKRGRDGIA